jgi:hypothetical protein
LSKVDDMLRSQRPGTLVEVPGANPYQGAYRAGGPFGPAPRNITPADEGAEAPKPAVRTVLTRLAVLEGALSDLNGRHTQLLERNLKLEAELKALRDELGTPEP